MAQSILLFCSCVLALTSAIVQIEASNSLKDSAGSSLTSRVKKRSYSPWTISSANSVSLYNAGNVFKPAPYAIRRPYYVPVYGYPGNLVFYPPQPLYVNPGTPYDNPNKHPYQAPSYLPPKETNTKKTTNRGGFDDDDDEDLPIWSDGGPMVHMPLSGDQNFKETIPTRPPISSLPSRPPLNREESELTQQAKESYVPPPNVQRPTTSKPQASAGPSNCVWAIISCCSASDPTVLPQNCFEQRGCPGPFWGDSPCNGEYARAAIAAAVNYYNSNPVGK